MDRIRNKSAAALGRAIEDGTLDPIDLAEFYFDEIKSCNVSDRIYARLMRERAGEEAQAARARQKSGTRRGLLDGVPVSWKDLFNTKGIATEAGSALYRDNIPMSDAAVLQCATQAGLVALGKTHMSELAFSGLGLNPITATSPCVNDAGAVSGGSSSGAAASVAFGLAAAAIGTDTGGSVRIPAAWNDLVGFKTTSGRLSLEGVIALAPSFDTVGPIARSVEDCALLLGALDGQDVRTGTPPDLSSLKFAVLETVAFDDIRAAPARGFDQALARIAAAGAKITRIEVPAVRDAMALSGVLFPAEAYATQRAQIEAAPERMFPPILDRFRAGRTVSAPDYIAGWAKLRQLRAHYLAATQPFDAVLLPTAPILPPNVHRLMEDSDYYVTENLLALRNTRIANLMGLPGLTLPTGVASCGLLLQTLPMSEARLLAIGAAVESVLGQALT
ncbi:Glutamyl-tRNA(Gln) amidotransferase subunit A [Aquimixticola soesokkakensis]|uniref:Glutamyl-tRNA(Gln) amidotransferase subunit A n=1 Tax=Aquimixticola soesokkakensis TaxID=1519096 RepID=A0A1Y5TUJ3_9RHOB|nr:amidase family protein [Aquimixticola soesokkakensis]SLN68553.1 Glutamyl-tRNA(Gln) amidotransferase subunit A [Aquimixticola soesokkakensis]